MSKKLIANSWDTIDKWIHDNTKGAIELPAGASNELLEEAEEMLGISFRDDIRESYKIHNGSAWNWICDRGYLLALYYPPHLQKKIARNTVEL